MAKSCDTFVVLPNFTEHGGIIFGKNSDRPRGEVQELVYTPSETYKEGDNVKCTYIEIPQVEKTYATILSKPAWMWGAEMGANEHGLVIGNEAVWTRLKSDDDLQPKLLGMDLVRLALERAKTASEAVDLITELLSKHGQGGCCSDQKGFADFCYHNSFLAADRNEAWILETAGPLWVAEKSTSGMRNISNCLTIGSKWDRCSEGLEDKAKELGVWDGNGEFHFCSLNDKNRDSGACRHKAGAELLDTTLRKSKNKFSVSDMFTVLRDTETGICRREDDQFPTCGSQVSVLAKNDSAKPDCHWFTATPDPLHSVFKPFVFTPDVRVSQHTLSPKIGPSDCNKTSVDRAHTLHRLHANAAANPAVRQLLEQMERECVTEMASFLSAFQPGQNLSELDDLLKDCIETEVKFYK